MSVRLISNGNEARTLFCEADYTVVEQTFMKLYFLLGTASGF